jgi:hypothetical protein
MEDASIDANEVTIGSRCSFILGTLPDDDPVYYWRVHASNDAGDGTWSGGRYFETHCAFADSILTPLYKEKPIRF